MLKCQYAARKYYNRAEIMNYLSWALALICSVLIFIPDSFGVMLLILPAAIDILTLILQYLVEQAVKNGFKILGFSDHCPWVFPDDYVSDMRMSPQMVDDYFQSLTDLKKEYQNDIKIYIGFESEYIPELVEAQDKFLADYPVDYMILGQHFMENEIYRGYTGIPSESEERLVKYVDSIIEGMESGRYKYVAHPDLFNFTGDNDIYEKHFTRLCEYLKNKNIPVEINALGVHDKRHYTS
jgi:histidinol-phosphatase (PHP family)